MLAVTEIDTEDTCVQQRLDGLGTVCAVQRGLALLVPRVGIGFRGSPFRVVPQQLDIYICLVPAFDGVLFTPEWRDALWDRFYTGAPKRQRQFAEQYKIVERA